MVRLTVRYDGKVLIPDEPVELPTGVPLRATIQTGDESPTGDAILALAGLGREVWAGVDPVEYQRREREGWE
ncbi:MAG: hypothetical protein V2A79_18780 [Planctomycetota bacterium]